MLHKPSHRVSTHVRWPSSRQADLIRPCVLVVSFLHDNLESFKKKKKKKKKKTRLPELLVTYCHTFVNSFNNLNFDHSHRSSVKINFWADEGYCTMRFISFGHGWEQYLHIIIIFHYYDSNYYLLRSYLVLPVDNEVISRISRGLMVLVGIGSGLCSHCGLYGF